MPSLTKLTAGAVLIVCSLPSPTKAQMGHAHHPMVSTQRFVIDVRIGDDPTSPTNRVPVELDEPTKPTTLEQRIALPNQQAQLLVKDYIPSAKLFQDVSVEDSQQARAMVQLLIEGPKQRYERWLVAGDPERNRLISLIGTWRFMVVDDIEQRQKLFADFDSELRREPQVRISAPDGSNAISVPCVPGTTQSLTTLGGTVTVREFFSHYALSAKSNQPVNVSNKRVNPGALIELSQGAMNEQRWIFSQFPDYTAGQDPVIPWKTTLDCPSEGKSGRPDTLIVMTRDGNCESWVRHGGETRVHRTAGPIDLPETQYSFRLSRQVPAGRLVESFRPTESSTGVPVMRLELTNIADHTQSVWLTPGKSRIVLVDTTPVSLTLHVDGVASGAHP